VSIISGEEIFILRVVAEDPIAFEKRLRDAIYRARQRIVISTWDQINPTHCRHPSPPCANLISLFWSSSSSKWVENATRPVTYCICCARETERRAFGPVRSIDGPRKDVTVVGCEEISCSVTRPTTSFTQRSYDAESCIHPLRSRTRKRKWALIYGQA